MDDVETVAVAYVLYKRIIKKTEIPKGALLGSSHERQKASRMMILNAFYRTLRGYTPGRVCQVLPRMFIPTFDQLING